MGIRHDGREACAVCREEGEIARRAAATAEIAAMPVRLLPEDVGGSSATTTTVPIEPDNAGRLDLSRFPHRGAGLELRPVYFDTLHPTDRHELVERGYLGRCLMELPRGTPAEESEYLLAKAQAVEEGTAYATKQTITSLELEMKANKMLNDRTPNVRVNLNMGARDAKALLASWGSSRHTLRGNTTIESAQSLKEAPARRGRKKKGTK